jgi:hypothetical protein
MKRRWWIAALVLAVLAAALPFFPADLLRAPIQRALERGLGRKVEIGSVHFTIFPSWTPAPGFTLDEVTIHEDPRAGIEPFAYVDSLGASVRLLSLFKRKLEFSSLNLGGQTVNINMVKTAAGPWNFQYLLGGPAGSVSAIPALRMRGGRVNFKFGDTKSVFFFDDADLDVAPGADGSVELRFGGAPARTDHSVQDFGRLFVRGTSAAGNRALDFEVQLERSSLEETLRLFDPAGFGIQGNIALEAQLSGPPSDLRVAGQMQVGGGLAGNPSAVKMPFNGVLDLRGERLALSSSGLEALTAHLNVRGLLSAPDWDAAADLAGLPVGPLLGLARHMGVAVSDKLGVDGTASGSLAYARESGFSGHVTLNRVSMTLPDAEPLSADEVALEIGSDNGASTVRLKPTSMRVGENRSVELEGSVALGAGLTGVRPADLKKDLKITTRGLSVAEMKSFGLLSPGPGAIPLLEHATQGIWRGWARFRGEWSGESELSDVRIPVDGLADPVEIKSAAISLGGKRATITRLRAKAGGVNFTGEYRWEQGAARPHRFRLAVASADAAELERLLDPALVRQRGFIARTLGLQPSAMPEWLAARHAEGTVSIDTLTAGESKLRNVWTRLIWDAGVIHLVGLNGRLDSGPAAMANLDGDLTIDVSMAAPQFHFEGGLRDVVWRGGRIDLEGILDADGSGLQLLESARAEGRLRGRGLAFAPEADFRTVAGEFQAGPGPARWKLSNLEVSVGPENFTGSGVSQADGKIVLDLANRSRQVHYAGPLLASGSAP